MGLIHVDMDPAAHSKSSINRESFFDSYNDPEKQMERKRKHIIKQL